MSWTPIATSWIGALIARIRPRWHLPIRPGQGEGTPRLFGAPLMSRLGRSPAHQRLVTMTLLVLIGLFGLLGAGSNDLEASEVASSSDRDDSDTSEDRTWRFNRDVRPILAEKCFSCHGPDRQNRRAGMRLDTAEGAYALTEMGVNPIVPGDVEASEVVWRINSEDDFEVMPPPEAKNPLNPEEIRILTEWIEQGALYESHWAYQTPKRPELPAYSTEAHPQSHDQGAIDWFLIKRLAEEGLDLAPEADPITLVRRLHLDLTGLPPTPEQVEDYLDDDRPDAYERLVERLLASPRYGERLAVAWLDLVRYADTVGYHGDQEHHAAPYRDWVIAAFNDNMPFDRFTAEQLAGDLLEQPDEDQRIASAYNRLLQTTHEGGAQDGEYRAKYAADRVRNISVTWMGMTLGCAECHDHKYDPLTQRDFYSLAAFFADLDEQGVYNSPNSTPTTRAPEIDVHTPFDRRRLATVEQQLRALRDDRPVVDDRSECMEEDTNPVGDRRRVDDLEAERQRLIEARRTVMVSSRVDPRVVRILPRGDWMDRSGPIVEPAVPAVLGSIRSRHGQEARPDRLDLARWLTDPENPLTSRTFVNRLWYQFFGQGLTPSLVDAGSQGGWPTHPELLDWLAREFSDSGWDVKHVVRQIVQSRAYRQSSKPRPEHDLERIDPDNRLFARQGRYRLPAEFVRDTALAISGLLLDELGGAPAKPYQPAGYYSHLNFPTRTYQADEDRNQDRRGVYIHWQRQFLHPMLRAFDAPSREECTARRPVSNTPLAALTLLNDPSFVEAARVLAQRVLQERQTDDERIVRLWRLAVSRPPNDREQDILRALLEQCRHDFRQRPGDASRLIHVGRSSRTTPEALGDRDDQVELAAWTQIARAVLNLNETFTRN